MRKSISEYSIIYKDGEELHTEDKDEAFAEFKIVGDSAVHQFYRKDYILVEGDYEEDWVEVIYG